MKKYVAVLKEGSDTSKFQAAVEEMGGVVRDANVKYILVELPGAAGDLKKLRAIPEVRIADTVKYAKPAGS
jgi:hypothetical protein